MHWNIKKLRLSAGFTRKEVARLLNITLNGYGKIERGEVDISIKRLYEIAGIFEVTILDFFDEKDSLVELMKCTCNKEESLNTEKSNGGIEVFESHVYIEFLEQRIAWLKAQLTSKIKSDEES